VCFYYRYVRFCSVLLSVWFLLLLTAYVFASMYIRLPYGVIIVIVVIIIIIIIMHKTLFMVLMFMVHMFIVYV